MADSLANMTGRDAVTIKLKGKEYIVSPLTLNDLADFESYIRSCKLKEFMETSEGLIETEERLNLIAKISSMVFDETEITNQMSTLSGIRFLLWKALERKQADLTLENVGNLVDLENFEEISSVVTNLGGGGDGDSINPPEES